MTPFSLRVEGWRGINHSYALVNQYQLLELRKRSGIELYHADLPLFDPAWSAARNDAGFTPAQQRAIASIPQPPGETDVVYRIGFPFRLDPAGAPRVFSFMTSENHRFYEQDVQAGPRGARLVTPSRWSREGLQANGFGDAAVVPHGVDTTLFHPPSAAEREAQRSALGLREHEVAFLNVSAMSFNKGVDVLVVAFCRLREKFRHVVLVLKDQSNLYGAGAKALVDDLARQMPRLLNRDAVGAIRIVSDNLSLDGLRRLYGAADAYVSPYRAEGFNIPPLEAAACGTPAILTAGGPTDDYFNSSFAVRIEAKKMSSDSLGVYLEPSLEHLVANMEAFVEQRLPDLDAKVGREWIARNFAWEKVVDRLVEVLSPDD